MTDTSETPDGLAERQAEAQGQQRHDQDAAAQPEQRPEDAGGGAAADHPQPDDHVGPARTETGFQAASDTADRGYGRRCCGAYGSRATCRARLSATASSRW